MTNSRAKSITSVVKTADQTVNNSATAINDLHLLLKLKANKEYMFHQTYFLNSGTTPDFKYKFAIPSGATIQRNPSHLASDDSIATQDGTTEKAFNATGGNDYNTIDGRITTGSTSGTLQFMWAQNVADVSDTKVLKGSCLVLYES